MERIVEHASRLLGKKIDWAIGGFHLMNSQAAEIDRTILALQGLDVAYVVPTHCTGDAAKDAFRHAFGVGCVDGGAGREIDLLGRTHSRRRPDEQPCRKPNDLWVGRSRRTTDRLGEPAGHMIGMIA